MTRPRDNKRGTEPTPDQGANGRDDRAGIHCNRPGKTCASPPDWRAHFLHPSLIAALTAAAIEDALRFRISNLTCVMVAAGALLAMAVVGPTISLWQNFALMLAIFAIGTAGFGAGLLGGGDVKLFAAAGLWLDLRGGLALVSSIFIAGGIVALAYLASRFIRRPAGPLRDRRVPYGIAIALGTLIVIAFARDAVGDF